MNAKKLLLFSVSLCLPLFFPSCSKSYESIEIFIKQPTTTRPPHLSPTAFDKQPNIVIMGDGYTAYDFDAFETAANNLISCLFSVPPFNLDLFSQYFNIYYLFLDSPERGIGHGKSKNTPFRCYFPNDLDEVILFDDTNNFGGRKAHNPFEVARQYISGINLNNTVLVILVNDNQTGYTTGVLNEAPYSQWISIISVPSDQDEFKRLILREVGGKNFGRLAQEDGSLYSLVIQDANLLTMMYNQYGYYANVDINDQPTQIRWAHFLQSPYLEKYPHLGIYEGGFGYALGVYHPDQNNVMLLHGNLSYDEPSQEAIIKRIYQIHEWPYTLEVFQSYF